jgi:serpin B
MKNISQTIYIAITLVILAGCTYPSGGRPPGLSAQSDKQRTTSPDVPASDQAELAGGNSAFAFDLYRLLRKEKEGNLFYSPYSISLALAMTYAGAHGETERQMADTLHYTLPQDQLHPAFNWLDLELAGRGEGAQGKDGEGFQLNIANALWGQEEYAFRPEFLDTLAVNYGAGMRLVDFTGDPEAARVAINNWASDQTEDRIKDLIPAGVIDELTRLVLTNAIYFNAAWAEPFEESQTQNGAFTLLDGSQVTVPMMHHTASYGYAVGKGYQAIDLPYDGREISMVILLPDEGTFDAFESSLDAEGVDAILNDLTYQEVALTLPKFEVESDFSLVEALAEMGMPIAFSTDADFSGMDGTRRLCIGDVLHKSFITVDEAGTEAAAATAVEMKLTSAPMDPVSVSVDHPFIFLIRDIETDAVLFIGCVVNPSA